MGFYEDIGRGLNFGFRASGARTGRFKCVFHGFSLATRESRQKNIFVGERLRWIFAPLAVSLQTLEAGTATFCLARLPRR